MTKRQRGQYHHDSISAGTIATAIGGGLALFRIGSLEKQLNATKLELSKAKEESSLRGRTALHYFNLSNSRQAVIEDQAAKLNTAAIVKRDDEGAKRALRDERDELQDQVTELRQRCDGANARADQAHATVLTQIVELAEATNRAERADAEVRAKDDTIAAQATELSELRAQLAALQTPPGTPSTE